MEEEKVIVELFIWDFSSLFVIWTISEQCWLWPFQFTNFQDPLRVHPSHMCLMCSFDQSSFLQWPFNQKVIQLSIWKMTDIHCLQVFSPTIGTIMQITRVLTVFMMILYHYSRKNMTREKEHRSWSNYSLTFSTESLVWRTNLLAILSKNASLAELKWGLRNLNSLAEARHCSTFYQNHHVSESSC